MLIQRQIEILIICSLSLVLATFAVGCRAWARAITRMPWQANDYLMLVAYV